MTDRPRPSREHISAEQAPELHNAEQDDDEPEQAQTVAEDALDAEARDPSPLDSVKPAKDSDAAANSSPDLIDRMRAMERSGRIDMDAYRGEPNMDDDEDKYGPENTEDDSPDDGAD